MLFSWHAALPIAALPGFATRGTWILDTKDFTSVGQTKKDSSNSVKIKSYGAIPVVMYWYSTGTVPVFVCFLLRFTTINLKLLNFFETFPAKVKIEDEKAQGASSKGA
jgi:hypothetical protein